MARLVTDFLPRDPELHDRIEFLVDGVKHTGRIVRIGNTRTWGHAISDLDNKRYSFEASEDGFRVL